MPICSHLSSKTGQKRQHDSKQRDSKQHHSNMAGTFAPQGHVPAAFTFPTFRDLISSGYTARRPPHSRWFPVSLPLPLLALQSADV
jgi:hypothetical protein